MHLVAAVAGADIKLCICFNRWWLVSSDFTLLFCFYFWKITFYFIKFSVFTIYFTHFIPPYTINVCMHNSQFYRVNLQYVLCVISADSKINLFLYFTTNKNEKKKNEKQIFVNLGRESSTPTRFETVRRCVKTGSGNRIRWGMQFIKNNKWKIRNNYIIAVFYRDSSIHSLIFPSYRRLVCFWFAFFDPSVSK